MMHTRVINRAGKKAVALETTLLLHGVPRGEGPALASLLADIVREEGATPALVGVIAGRPVVGMTDDELAALFAAKSVAKANTSNLGPLMHRGEHAATTVSTTMELAAAADVRVFATGGLGGVHMGYGTSLDISADLAAFTRFPVAVVTSGVKSILDVVSTREALETLGIPVLGFGTDRFPAFYLRESAAKVDARFDDINDLAACVKHELERTGRGIVIANPIPHEAQIPQDEWDAWLIKATETAQVTGRDATPAILGALHTLSGGRTLYANIELVKSNTRLAARLAAAMAH
jgi:pseudouridine-5'-phosphate glycosidase